MDKKLRVIKPVTFYLMNGLILFHIYMFIYCLINFPVFSLKFHITNWSDYLSTFYLISIFVIDISLYCFKSNKLEKYNLFIRETFAQIAFPFSYMISIGFWSILLCGLILGVDTFKEGGIEITVNLVLVNLYVHLAIALLLTLDLYLTYRTVHGFNKKNFVAISLFFCIYLVVIFVEQFKFDQSAYVFMKDLSPLFLILGGIIIYTLLTGCYFLYLGLLKLFNRANINRTECVEDDERSKEGLIENEVENGSDDL